VMFIFSLSSSFDFSAKNPLVSVFIFQ
jgi:hypothetical protein